MSSIEYNVTIELDTDQPAESFADSIPADEGAAAAAVVHTSAWGRPALTVTVRVPNVHAAVALALTLLRTWTDADPYSVEALPTDEFDRRTEQIGQPAWLSVPQAAEALGVSEQRVRQLISGPAPRLEGTKTGREWLVSRTSVDARLAEQQRTA